MVDMSEHTPPPTGTPTSSGPRVSGDQMRDFDRLRRSTGDRYIAGVAGGLARHFDIDPTVVRVLLVVLTLFGGAGVVIYAAVWLFVPEEGRDQAPIQVTGDVLRVILIVAAVVALAMAFGTPFFDTTWGLPVPLLVIALIAVAVFTTRGQRRSPAQPPPPWGNAGAPTAPNPQGAAMSVTDQSNQPTTSGLTGQQPPAWMPPAPPPYVPPPRPRRTGPVLFWPTLALIAIGLGTLGILDTTRAVSVTAYAALALTITGAMLVVGAFRGRPGGLIALGLASTLALMVTSAVVAIGADTSDEDVRFYPTTGTELASDYRVSSGSITLDLTGVSDPRSLDGRTVTLDISAGEITVIVPRTVDVHVAANITYAGEISVGDVRRGGFSQSFDSTLGGSPPDAPQLDLAISARVGQITVRQSQ